MKKRAKKALHLSVIFATVYLGIVARKKALITPEGVQGLQQFVLNIAPSLGKTEQEQTVASGVSSLLTVVTLAVFCAIAALTA